MSTLSQKEGDILQAAVAGLTVSPEGQALHLGALGANHAGCWISRGKLTQEEAGRQVIFHGLSKPWPGTNFQPSKHFVISTSFPNFQHQPHLSLALSPWRTWGSASPHLPSALPKQRLQGRARAHRHTHQARTPQDKLQKGAVHIKKKKPTGKGQRSAQIQGNLLCRLCISTVSLWNACLRQWKKNPKSCSSIKWTKSPRLPHPLPAPVAVRVPGSREYARRGGGAAGHPRRLSGLRTAVPAPRPAGTAVSPPLAAGSATRSQPDFATVPGRKRARALARLP